jgi:hypothetical protein
LKTVSMLTGALSGILVVVFLAVAQLAGAQTESPRKPDQIDYAMFPLADLRDSPECHVTASAKPSFGPAITNPSVSCPDAFAWSMFVRIVSEKFWEDWTTDRQLWPSDPWLRCRPGSSGKECCPAIEISNNASPEHCPVFPGPTPGVPLNQVRVPVTAHQIDLASASGHGAQGKWDDVPAILKAPVIGALQEELIYRNRPMVDYVFDNELYFTEGLTRVHENLTKALATMAPRRPRAPHPSAAHETPPPIVKVDFPIASIMVKANWLRAELAPKIGIDPYDAKAPYVIMDFIPHATAEQPSPGKTPYILLSLHISSKDLPNWTWATFEHVSNQGRCDWLGCNDSFGYLTPPASGGVATIGPPADNYLPPHRLDRVGAADVTAFDLAHSYPETQRMSEALQAMFGAAGIGTGQGVNRGGDPGTQDAAWKSYRLKGSQVDFVTGTGQVTRLGNSVTEAGFANSSSCITCHSRAAITSAGVPAFAIFRDKTSDAGLAESVNGPPNPAWFSVNAFFGTEGQRESPAIRAVQTDFVWGFRFACPTTPSNLGPVWCKNVKAGYSTPAPTRSKP